MATENEEKTGPVEDTQGEATPQEGQHAADPLAEAKAEAARMKEMWMRSAADFDNFRKRALKDLAEERRRAKEDAIRELLPVIDNLERAVSAAATATDVSAVVEGIRMVLKLFEDQANRLGLTKVKAVGERFDPAIHDAIQQIETDEHPPGTVIAEVVAGFRLGDKLVRPAMVVVARKAASA